MREVSKRVVILIAMSLAIAVIAPQLTGACESTTTAPC